MKIIVNYYINADDGKQYFSEMLDINDLYPILSREYCKSDIDFIVANWAKKKQDTLDSRHEILISAILYM